jgi:hypothetical protein
MNLYEEDADSVLDEDDEEDLFLLYSSILLYNSMRNRHYMTRSAIIHQDYSPWAFMLRSADALSFMSCCGVDRLTFGLLLGILWPHGEMYTTGRHAALNNEGKFQLGYS